MAEVIATVFAVIVFLLYPYCHCGAKMCLEGENNDD